jgi:hypothetical protein
VQRCQVRRGGWDQLPCMWSFHPPH